MNPIHDHNRAAWDARVQRGQRFTMAATDDEMERPLEILDPSGWLGGDVKDRRILCLGAGGGRHGPMLANAGARVTVVDPADRRTLLDELVRPHAPIVDSEIHSANVIWHNGK